MPEATVYWLETSEEEVHFIDAIISAYDGLANVRRDYRLRDGKTYFKVYVGPGLEPEFEELIERIRPHAQIGALVKEDVGDEAAAPE